MERASRLIVIASIVLAGATHAWLATWHPWLPVAAAAAFAITFLLARLSLPLTLVPVFGAVYLMPALYYVVMGGSALSVDFQLTLVWLAAVAGPLLAHSDRAAWHLPARWTLPLAGWALVLALSWPIVAGREIDFSLIAARTLDTSNALAGAPPRMAAAWVVIIALAQMLGILWIDLLWARFSGSNLAKAERYVMLPMLAGTALGAAVALYQKFVDLTWMNPGIWPRMGRASGLMLDANTFGIGAAIWAPAAIVLAWRLGKPVWMGALCFALLSAGMWTAGSRTALLAWSAGTFGLLVAIAQRKGLWQPRVAQIVMLVGAALLVLAMFVAPRGGNSPSPLQRVFDRLPRPEAADLRRFADEMWDRFGYGRAAALMIADHPLTGVGIGAFHVVLNDYYTRATGGTLRADNAQNWWRHQLAELGAVGGFPSLAMSVVIVVLLWYGGPYTEPLGATTVLRLVIAGLGFASFLGVPTQNPATWFSFATLLFWLAAMYGGAKAPPLRSPATATAEAPPLRLPATEKPEAPPLRATDPAMRSISRAMWMVVFAIALFTAAGVAASARGNLRVPVRALQNSVPYKYGFAPIEGFSTYGFLRWAAAHAVEVMPVEKPWLQLAIYPPEDQDIAANPIAVRVWVNERRVIQHTLVSHEPLVHVLQVPPDGKWMMLEVTASGFMGDDRALRVAHEWLPEVPAHAAPDRVIRW